MVTGLIYIFCNCYIYWVKNCLSFLKAVIYFISRSFLFF